MTPITATVPADTNIHTRALLVWLTIRTWSARKYDRKASAETTNAHNAASDAGRFNKFLLPGDAKSYKALTALAAALRAEHYGHTLAWSDEGWRVLPVTNYTTYTDWLRARRVAFNSALSDFLADYPAMRINARAKLGTLWQAEDYPDANDIRQRFTLDVQYMPLPAEGDIRVSLASDQVANIEAHIRQQTADALQSAMSDAWSRLHDVVTKVHDRLSVPDAIFRDSLIRNVSDVCASLQRLNVAQDPNLDRLCADAMRELTRVDPDVLRDTPSTRADIAAKADSILESMAAYYSA